MMLSTFGVMFLTALGVFALLLGAVMMGGLSLKGDPSSDLLLAICFTPAAVWGAIGTFFVYRLRWMLVHLLFTLLAATLALLCWNFYLGY